MEKEQMLRKRKIGYYLIPYTWVKEYPSENQGTNFIDGQKAKALVEQINISSQFADVNVEIFCDGLFMFEFLKIKRKNDTIQPPIEPSNLSTALTITQILNTHLACLWLSICATEPQAKKYSLETFSISPHDFLKLEEYDNGCSSIGSSNYSFFKSVISARTQLENRIYNAFDEKSEFFHRFSPPINGEAVKLSLTTFDAILKHKNAPKLIILFELLSKSYQARHIHDWDWSLMIAWVAIESALSDLWRNFIEGHKNKEINDEEINFIDGTRKDRLSSFNSSVQLEFLSFTNELDFELFKQLQSIRKCRNDWVHSLKPVSEQDSKIAILSLINFLSHVYKISLPKQPSTP